MDWTFKASVCFISALVDSSSSRRLLAHFGIIPLIFAVCLHNFEDPLQNVVQDFEFLFVQVDC